MNLEIAAVLLILAAALALFITDKLRMDVVALLVMSALGISGLVTPQDALAGFSNPAVITVWSMFILSAGLSATGLADVIGRQVLFISGKSETRMVLTIMLTSGTLSAFMNNIGVAALMLPVVMDVARRTGVSPSRLLMPMAYGCLLGGLTTLVGTPPNLVASDALKQAGHPPFTLFSFSPFGVPALVAGSLFVALLGRRLLPKETPAQFRKGNEEAGTGELRFGHGLEQHRFRVRVQEGSPFAGKSLAEISLGGALGLNVFAVERGGVRIPDIGGEFVLQDGDVLHAQGRIEEFEDLLRWQSFELAQGEEIAEVLGSRKLALVSAVVDGKSDIAGLTVKEADFRNRFDAHILTVKRGGKVIRRDFADFELKGGDRLQMEVRRGSLPEVQAASQFSEVHLITEESIDQIYPPSAMLLQIDLPADSRLIGMTLAGSGFSEMGLRVLGIARRGGSVLMPGKDETLKPGDRLLVHASREATERLQGLRSLELLEDPSGPAPVPARGGIGYTEVTLSPQSQLAGKTLRQIDFRNRYGLQVLSIWRRERSFTAHLRNIVLRFGDALVLSGPRGKIEALAEDPDFLILSRSAYEDPESKAPMRALLSAAIMLGVVGMVLFGILPVALSAVAGATLMVVTRCLSIEEAYRAIEWKSVFLIACMIPLGIAMKESGAAEWLAQGVARWFAPFGPLGLVIGLYLMTMLASAVVPTVALVLIMVHIGMDAAKTFDLPPEMMVMAIAMATAASFTSPISHPANVLVMGPGGYRFVDYLKLGIPLAFVVAMTVLPLLWWRWHG